MVAKTAARGLAASNGVAASAGRIARTVSCGVEEDEEEKSQTRSPPTMVLQQSEFWLAGVQGMVAQHSIACASAIAGVKQSIEYSSKNAPKMSSRIGLALCISLTMVR